MLTDRANAICLLEILREFSDEEHILPMREIVSKMNLTYGINPDRRTVYSAISLLTELGHDISTYEENGIGYYLRSREFEKSEIHLLSDAVYSFPFISPKQTDELVGKLQKQLSVHQRKSFKHLTIAKSEKKTDNRQVFLNIECLDEAIDTGKQVSFTYLQYDLDKKQHPRREKPYVVNPYELIYTNEHYYLICNYVGHDNTSFYRIDRMCDIKVLETKIDKKTSDLSDFRNATYAFASEPERIVLHCDKWMIDEVIDKFGTDISIAKLDEEKISVSFTAPSTGIKFFALQYLPYMEVIKPEWIRSEIINNIKENKYEKLLEKMDS